MKLPMYISTHSDWTSNLLNVGFFCQDFFSLLAEALDLGLGELLALVQLLDPLVQLLGEQLLVHPGMTREELIGVNAGIVKSVTDNVLKYSPNAVILCVSNPMDTMTYLIHKTSGLPKNRIIGMGGALDSSRFKYFLSVALGANPNEVEGMVIGGHGDTTMIPLTRYATYRGIPVSTLLDKETLDKVAADTMVGGATLTGLLGTSAWYAPGAASAAVVAAVLHDQKRVIPCSALVEGEYGESDICIGVPCLLGRNGIEKIVDVNLNEEEKALFAKSAAAVRKTNGALASSL